MAEPKIILFDLEIIPDLQQALKVWPRIGQWPGKTLRASITSICCIGWKIYGQKKTHCINAWDYPNWKKNVNDDSRVIEEFLKICEDADALIAHNGKRFDWRYFKTRLIKHNKFLPNIPQIDTKEVSARHLFLFDNKLDTLGEFLVNEKKMDHEGWDLWVKTHGKEKKAMDIMAKYCKQDVKLLERVFEILRPYINNIPNHNVFNPSYALGKNICPNCGSTRLRSKGWRHTKTQSYKRYECMDCHSYSRTDKKDKMPRSI